MAYFKLYESRLPRVESRRWHAHLDCGHAVAGPGRQGTSQKEGWSTWTAISILTSVRLQATVESDANTELHPQGTEKPLGGGYLEGSLRRYGGQAP